MTKRQEIAQETRRRIYTTACSLIEKKGFANVSVEDITRACGVAKGTFYVYFKRKEEIIFECCKEWFSDVDRKAREHKGTIIEKLAFYFKGFMEGVTCGGVELCRQWVREVINPADSPGGNVRRQVRVRSQAPDGFPQRCGEGRLAEEEHACRYARASFHERALRHDDVLVHERHEVRSREVGRALREAPAAKPPRAVCYRYCLTQSSRSALRRRYGY